MLCPKCRQPNDDEARFCRKCGSTIYTGGSTGGGAGPLEPPAVRFAVGKSPGTALFFAIVPGFGQFYNGDFKRGILIVILSIVTLSIGPPTLFTFFGAVWLWGLTNAHNVAGRKTPLWT
jgi:TM2 domain-containing membrane protein YozV